MEELEQMLKGNFELRSKKVLLSFPVWNSSPTLESEEIWAFSCLPQFGSHEAWSVPTGGPYSGAICVVANGRHPSSELPTL